MEKIIAHRTYKKLHSTYVQGLLENLDEQDRVHTQFNQTVTATGRLSSSNPNLQNIPVGERRPGSTCGGPSSPPRTACCCRPIIRRSSCGSWPIFPATRP